MSPISSIVAWIGFGVVAAIVAMIHPYHRGWRGILTNVFLGIAGAVLGGFAARALGLVGTVRDPASFLFSVIGAAAMLFLGHALWARRHHAYSTHHHQHHGAA